MFNDLKARSIEFRLVEEDDAEFIYNLRINETYNTHLSKVSGNITSQREWIKSYKLRESEKSEFYFIILRSDNKKKIGTVRLYDFIQQKKSFCWGSWILNQDKTTSSAIESALLVYNIAFQQLGFERCHFDVRKDNVKVIQFHKKLGAEIINSNEVDYFFNYKKESYINCLHDFSKYLVTRND
ncbi:GNAT family N-acetyltransferase [Enterobacteriaceae bacterium H18W14]|uniref:GNAT family N-acetyltransferase n=1 Tax=Dryocola boscaweniae TaxID=2925397 RepID=UPI0022F0CABD|nr:GNAT family N-acetyltransferase [Dryocola boscaweniae]MCT4716369.1 GNAT family N-acetyltransferase [Dryocola boscaweniae]